MDAIGLETARDRIGEIADRAGLAGTPTLLKRHGKPRAFVVGYDAYLEQLTMLAAGCPGGDEEKLLAEARAAAKGAAR